MSAPSDSKATATCNLLQVLNKLSNARNPESVRGNLFRARLDVAKNLYKKDLVSHFGCVNAVEFDKTGQYLISGGDDRRVLLWNVEQSLADKGKPRAMDKQHLSNIFCLSFNNDNTKIFSGGNDDTVIVHDMKTGDALDVFFHNKPVYGLSVSTENDNIFSTAGEDGRILLFDLRTNTEAMNVVKYRAPFHGVMFHPQDGNFVITANAKEGAGFWDLRSQKMPAIRYGGEDSAQSCMSVRFNSLGTQVLALRRRLPPILYRTEIAEPICQFYHSDYYNSCTMKSCCFAGEFDEFVLSGSDDFNLYCWRVDDADMENRNQWLDRTQMVLFGHRSIVNQVRYNYQKCLIASSGVEKIIKIWSPFAEDNWSGSLVEESQGPENPRDVFSHEEYMSLMHSSGQNMTHDYTNQNTTEDPRMMAFFDYLVQQEIEGWDSESSDHSSEHSSENSSRPCSSQSSSDAEPTTSNYLGGPSRATRDLSCRRGDTNTTRTKYRNRIAYLIATKRNTLKRLALKNANRTSRRIKNKYNGGRQQAKQTRNSLRLTRKMAGKRVRRVSSHKYTKRPASREQTSDSEVPKTSMKKRRHIQQHLNSSNYRTFRRKTKTPLSSTSNTSTRLADDESNTSSDDDDRTPVAESNDEDTALPTCSKTLINGRVDGQRTPASMASVPSTSTGITGSGKNLMFRIVQQQPDSDDDDDDGHSIPETNNVDNSTLRVITSPVNGYNHYYANQQPSQPLRDVYFAEDDDEGNVDDINNNTENQQEALNNNNNNYNNNNHNNGNNLTAVATQTVTGRTTIGQNNGAMSATRRKRPAYDQSVDSSHSNSRLSSSYQEDGSTSNDSFIEYFNKKRKFYHNSSNGSYSHNNISSNNNNNHHLNNRINNAHLMTPVNSPSLSNNITPNSQQGSHDTEHAPLHNLLELRGTLHYTPDSGIQSTTSGSSGNAMVGGSSVYKLNDTNSTPATSVSENGNGNCTGWVGANTNSQKSSYTSKVFQQKIAKVRKNYRNHFGDDSDSD